MGIHEQIDPDFEDIIEKCKQELKIKFPRYGNTWLEADDKYYKARLINEVDEYLKSMTVDSEKRKLLNIINIAAMAFQVAHVNRAKKYVPEMCPFCDKSLLRHKPFQGGLVCPLRQQSANDY